MKIYYLNDTKHPVTVRLLGPSGKEWENMYVQLGSIEGKMFEFDAPDGHVPFVKTWGNVVLLSSVDPAVFAQQPQSRPPEDAL